MRRLFALCFWVASAVVATAPAFAQTYLVSPFSNLSKVASFDWLGESLAETLRETLDEEGFATVGRDDREEAAKKLGLKSVSDVSLASLAKLCEATGADRLIYGRIEFLPNPPGAAGRGTLRVTARALDVQDVVQIGEFFESGAVQEIQSIEIDLAWKIQRWAKPGRQTGLDEFRRLHPVVKNAARERYIRGLMAPTPEQRHRLLTQAVRLDAAFSQPLFVLGREHFLKGNFREAAGWLEGVPERNVDFIESRFLLALCRYQLSDFEEARAQLERIALRLPAPELWNNLGAAQARLNDPRSLDSFKQALESDANDSDYQFNVGYSLWKRGDFVRAADYFRSVLDRANDDQDAIQLLGRCLKQSGPRPGDWRTDGLERLKETYEQPAPR